MPVARLKGLNQTTVTLRSGRRVTYWYAWKGGPRLPGKPGSTEFNAAFNAAIAGRASRSRNETLAGLVAFYRERPEFTRLAPSTRREWNRWLDRIAAHDIGGLTYDALEDRSVRSDLLDWRDEYADRPRTADYAMQVLCRVLSVAQDRGKISVNPVAKSGDLWESDRAEEIWLPDEVMRFTASTSPEVGFIVRLACLTGMRAGDLSKLAWSHVGDLAIIRTTGKSRGRKTQVVPLIDETRALLAEIRAQQARRAAELHIKPRRGQPAPPAPLTVLTNTLGLPWAPGGLSQAVSTAREALSITKHLHDARGTFCTRLRLAKLTAPEIADVVGWSEERVERLLAIYVDRDRIVLELARRIQGNGSGPETPK